MSLTHTHTQSGRRPPDQGNAIHAEVRIQQCFVEYSRHLLCSMDLALHRDEYRTSTEWVAFGGEAQAHPPVREG